MEFHVVTSTSLAVLVAIAFVLVFYVVSNRRTSPYRLPPGPKGYPILGNIVSKDSPWLQLHKWTEEYGPLYTIHIGMTPAIVIGSVQTAVDILEKRSAVTSCRPRLIVADIISGGLRIVIRRHDDGWRKFRKVLHQDMTGKAATEYQPIQEKAARRLMSDLLEDPDNHQEHTKRYAATVIMSVVYGKRTPTSYSDPEVKHVQRLLLRIGRAMLPGQYFVDSWPSLKYFPSKWKSDAKKWHEDELSLFKGEVDKVVVNMQNREVDKCFVTHMFDTRNENQLTDDEIAYLAGSLFGPGSDTTASTLSVLIMASACFPEAQRKAQEELDRVIGRDRAPTWTDRDDLPYIEAYFREVFRWRSVVPGGLMHSATDDIVYDGYHIPKGSILIGNHWSIHHDPSVFPDPDTFNPDRFLSEVNGEAQLNNLPQFTFGFGRRVCIGREVATRSLYINCAMILWAFNIEKKIDPATGKEVDIDVNAFNGLTSVSQPLPFDVSIKPRIPRQVLERETAV